MVSLQGYILANTTRCGSRLVTAFFHKLPGIEHDALKMILAL